MESGRVKLLGRIALGAAFIAVGIAAFRDGILYLAGSEKSRIVHLQTNTLTYIRSGELNFGGPGIHVQPVALYRSSDGSDVAVYQPAKLEAHRLFLRARHNVYSKDHSETVPTYEPFVLWAYLLKRTAALFIVAMLVLAVAGLALKILPRDRSALG